MRQATYLTTLLANLAPRRFWPNENIVERKHGVDRLMTKTTSSDHCGVDLTLGEFRQLLVAAPSSAPLNSYLRPTPLKG
jgi:hypothetical protein